MRGNEEWMKAGDGKEAEKKNRSSSIGQLKRERERERAKCGIDCQVSEVLRALD